MTASLAVQVRSNSDGKRQNEERDREFHESKRITTASHRNQRISVGSPKSVRQKILRAFRSLLRWPSLRRTRWRKLTPRRRQSRSEMENDVDCVFLFPNRNDVREVCRMAPDCSDFRSPSVQSPSNLP